MKTFITRIVEVLERVRQDIKCIDATIAEIGEIEGLSEDSTTSLYLRRAQLLKQEKMAVKHLNIELTNN